MAETESEHLQIFKCLVETGADVLRNVVETKLLNKNSVSFHQYLDSNKHQFYHQFQKNRNEKCCLETSHGCGVKGNMDKKIFNKVYKQTAQNNTSTCLDRYEIQHDISVDDLDLSDLNFFLWNSGSLLRQEQVSLQEIMSIRSDICHPSTLYKHSLDELKQFWVSLEDAILLFAEPNRYKKSIRREMSSLRNQKFSTQEIAKLIIEMRAQSEKIMNAFKAVSFKCLKTGNLFL